MKNSRAKRPFQRQRERVIYFMSEGILTASITESGGISFQTTAIQLSATGSGGYESWETTKASGSFTYTPSFFIIFITSLWGCATGGSASVDGNTIPKEIVFFAATATETLLINAPSIEYSNYGVYLYASANGSTITLRAQSYGYLNWPKSGFSVCVYGAI